MKKDINLINECIEINVNVSFSGKIKATEIINCIKNNNIKNNQHYIGYLFQETPIELFIDFITINEISIEEVIKTYKNLPPIYKSERMENWLHGMGKFI